jgi:phospholipase A1/A2
MWRIKTNACLSILMPAVILAVMLAATTAAAGTDTTAAARTDIIAAAGTDTTAAAGTDIIAAAGTDTTAAAGTDADIKKCGEIREETARLKCYDAASGIANPGYTSSRPADFVHGEIRPDNLPKSAPTFLSYRWELEPATKNGTWILQPYYPVYILPVKYTNHINTQPDSPTRGELATPVDIEHTEAEFQLSFKVKALENVVGNADLWFAYTQQSYWQVYASSISRPFRETDYQPEVFMVFPTNYNLLGLTGRFIQVSAMHQSNGRADPISRSWNRIYANFGFERGNFALYVRPWYRIPEKIEDDDNPDIHRYMGYGDITGIYKWGRQEFSLLVRYQPYTSDGAFQGNWSFPIQGRLRGFVQGFYGYGESLIDYNFRQTTIGAGIELVEWL